MIDVLLHVLGALVMQAVIGGALLAISLPVPLAASVTVNGTPAVSAVSVQTPALGLVAVMLAISGLVEAFQALNSPVAISVVVGEPSSV